MKNENSKKRWFGSLIVRRFLITVILLIQLMLIGYILLSGSKYSPWINVFFQLASLIVALYVISSPTKGGFKLGTVFLILIFPVFGGMIHIFFNGSRYGKKTKKGYTKLVRETGKMMYLNTPAAYDKNIRQGGVADYLEKGAGFPAFENTRVDYYSPGEKYFEALLCELEKAEKYIFLEYFIISEGKMWNSILEVLERKAAEGVDVRVIYDDFGCFFLLPENYPKLLEKKGIKCLVFNPFRIKLTAIQNNRTHRKIAVIDGKTAFTGGINLSDEYINEIEKHGHWKDSGICLKGDAAWSFAVMFLQMWQFISKKEVDIEGFYPGREECKAAGYVIPFSDSPMDSEFVGEQVYTKIINGAREYLYITTPYLIIDDSTVSALGLAAKSGVDVRIITPKIYDKRIVHQTTRSYYRELISSGVRIYEYTPGFIHAKSFVSDDAVAVVGTVNMDYRSLYLHFECGAVLLDSPVISDIREDFMKTIEKSKEITLKDTNVSVIKRLYQYILRVFSPVM